MGHKVKPLAILFRILHPMMKSRDPLAADSIYNLT